MDNFNLAKVTAINKTSKMIILYIYFLIGFIYLVLTTIFGDVDHTFTIYVRRLIIFVLFWPLILFSIFLKYGKILKTLKRKTIWRIFMLGTDKEYERKKHEEQIAIFNEQNKSKGLRARLWDDDEDEDYIEDN